MGAFGGYCDAFSDAFPAVYTNLDVCRYVTMMMSACLAAVVVIDQVALIDSKIRLEFLDALLPSCEAN